MNLIKTASIFLLSVLSLNLYASDNNSEKSTTKLTPFIARPGAVINMDYSLFKEKIYDKTASPDVWKYLGDKPCVIDFYTTWCRPCKLLDPVMEQIAEKYDGLINIYRIDAEKELQLSRMFNIRSYPTLMFIPMNGKPQIAIGALPKADLEKLISNILLK